MFRIALFVLLALVSGTCIIGCSGGKKDYAKSNKTWTTPLGNTEQEDLNQTRLPVHSKHFRDELRVFINYQNTGDYQEYLKVSRVLADPEFIAECERIGIRLREVGINDEAYDVLIQVRQRHEIPGILGNAELYHNWYFSNVGDINLREGMSHELVYRVLLHEVGHLVGAGHSDDIEDVMYPFIQKDGYSYSNFEANWINSFAEGNFPVSFIKDFEIEKSHFANYAFQIAAVSSYTLPSTNKQKAGRIATSKYPRVLSISDIERGWSYHTIYIHTGLLNKEYVEMDEIIVQVEGFEDEAYSVEASSFDPDVFALSIPMNHNGETRFRILYKDLSGEGVNRVFRSPNNRFDTNAIDEERWRVYLKIEEKTATVSLN